MVPPAAAAALQAGSMPDRAISARSSSVAGGVRTIRTASDRDGGRVPRPCCAGRAAYWRAMCMRSSASESSVSFPLTSTVTLWMVPVNLNGLA